MKVEKISKMALYVCVGIILVCFALFLTIGYDNQVGEYNEPKLTNLIMWLMYIMAIVTAVLVIWSVIRGVQNAKGSGGASASGVPGRKIAIFTICLLIVSFIVGIVFGLGAEDYTAADGTVTTAGWVTVVDAFCISIGIMFLAAAAAVGVSMTGVLAKGASK
jgi:hypothetical protein